MSNPHKGRTGLDRILRAAGVRGDADAVRRAMAELLTDWGCWCEVVDGLESALACLLRFEPGALDTTVPVLAAGKTRTGRLWTYVRDDRPFGGTDPPAAMFYYSRDRRGEQGRSPAPDQCREESLES